MAITPVVLGTPRERFEHAITAAPAGTPPHNYQPVHPPPQFGAHCHNNVSQYTTTATQYTAPLPSPECTSTSPQHYVLPYQVYASTPHKTTGCAPVIRHSSGDTPPHQEFQCTIPVHVFSVGAASFHRLGCQFQHEWACVCFTSA